MTGLKDEQDSPLLPILLMPLPNQHGDCSRWRTLNQNATRRPTGEIGVCCCAATFIEGNLPPMLTTIPFRRSQESLNLLRFKFVQSEQGSPKPLLPAGIEEAIDIRIIANCSFHFRSGPYP